MDSGKISASIDIDVAEYLMKENFVEIDPVVIHRFTPGLYIREIQMPAGSLVTSKIHRTEHPFTILSGDVSVYSFNEGTVRYKGPFLGITKPHTRRILFNHEDTIWVTFHPAEETDVDEIEKRIIEPHFNPLLTHSDLVNLLIQEE
jgi:hypothetical protein